MTAERVVVIGAGVGGLVAALELAHRGCQVTLCERAATPGGKMREVKIGRAGIDAGPTVLTMRWVFDRLFDDLGLNLDDHLQLHRAECLARHAWSEDQRLDLFADLEQSVDAIGDFAGAGEAESFRRFSAHAQKVFDTLEKSFIGAAEPAMLNLFRHAGLRGLGDLLQIKPFTPLWRSLGTYFRDPRLRQLFGRYATYCGSSPFLAPATLKLVAHVEQRGVWLIDGGMHRLAQVLAELAARRGVSIRYAAEVERVCLAGRRVDGVLLADGERLDADAVIYNADPAALAAGRFGPDAARAIPPLPPAARSLSAITWNLLAPTDGFPLSRHNVFFGNDYVAEFDDILRHRRLPSAPTVYVCAQDRGADDAEKTGAAERLLCLVNAPADGDSKTLDAAELARCEQRAFALLSRCGLNIERNAATTITTTPADFERLFPATGGALYGQATHGWRASFSRPGVRSRIAGLYLAGGSVHPGPGVPMAALSGRLAASSLLGDLTAATRRGRVALSSQVSLR